MAQNKQQQQSSNNTTQPASSQNPFNILSTGTNWNFNSGGLTQAPLTSTQPQTTQIPADIQDRTLKDLADIWQDELDVLKKKYDRQAEAVYRMDALIRKNQDKVKNLMRNYISQKNSQDYVKTKSSEILEGQKELFKQLEDLETKVDKEIEDNKGDQVQSRLEMFLLADAINTQITQMEEEINEIQEELDPNKEDTFDVQKGSSRRYNDDQYLSTDREAHYERLPLSKVVQSLSSVVDSVATLDNEVQNTMLRINSGTKVKLDKKIEIAENFNKEYGGKRKNRINQEQKPLYVKPFEKTIGENAFDDPTQTTVGSIFNTQSSTSGNIFGNQIQSSGGNLFGNQNQSTGGNLFGNKVQTQASNTSSGFAQIGGSFSGSQAQNAGGIFGNLSQSTGGIFGNQNQSTGGNLIGNQNQSNPFQNQSQPSGNNLFGNQSQSSGNNIFGNQTSAWPSSSGTGSQSLLIPPRK